jgi:DNA-binding NarL/FixJ family response regulator
LFNPNDRAIAILRSIAILRFFAATAHESSIFMTLATETALIVDDDEFFRMALRTVLTGTLGFSDVLEAENFDRATALLSEKKIDLAVFDLMMPGMAGPSSLKAVRDRFPDLCLVMATVSNRREDILLALQAGVNGYIAKTMGLTELSSALKQIVGGTVYVPVSITSLSITGSSDEIAATAVSDLAPPLTPRQKDVLTLIVKGKSNKEIARELELGEGTVKVHMAALFRVLGVRSRSAAAAKGAIIASENARISH